MKETGTFPRIWRTLVEAAFIAALAEEIIWEGEQHYSLWAAVPSLIAGQIFFRKTPWFRAPLSPIFAGITVLILVFAAGVYMDDAVYSYRLSDSRAPLTWGTIGLVLCMAGFCRAAITRSISAARIITAFYIFLGTLIIILFAAHAVSEIEVGKIFRFSDDIGFAAAAAFFCSRGFRAKKPEIEPRSFSLQSAACAAPVLLALGLFVQAEVRLLRNPLPVPEKYPFQVARSFLAQLLVSEDPLFVQHYGIDFRRMRDSLREAFETGHYGRGGSTLSMQLAKVRYLSYDKTLFRKAQQVTLALLIELQYSKDAILWRYINDIPFGADAIGIDAAATKFFNVEPAKLSRDQSKLLVLSIPDPAAFNPSIAVMPKETQIFSHTINARYAEYGEHLRTDIDRIAFAGH